MAYTVTNDPWSSQYSIGVGTETPELHGALAVRRSVSINSKNVSFSTSDAALSTFDIRHLSTVVDLSSQNSNLTFSTSTSTSDGIERMRITQAGNVGIGTNNPVFSLDVSVPTNNQGIRINSVQAAALYLYSTFNDAGNRNWGIYNNSNVFGDFDIRQSNAKDGDMTVGANSTSRLYINNTGFVSIGTTLPPSYGGGGFGLNIGYLNLQNTVANQASYANNVYYNGSAWKSVSNSLSYAQAIRLQNGYIDFHIAPVSTSGQTMSNFDTTDKKMSINPSGNVGIGTASPGNYKLNVNGTFYSAGSSLEYKTEISTLDTDTNKILELRPVTYQYKDEYKHLGKELKSGTQIGLIAEEVAEVFPELAMMKEDEDGETRVRNVDYEKLSILLLSEIQKLRKEVNELKNK